MIDKIVFDYERTELENGISALKIPRQKFDSYKEIDHLLRYITRTRDNENEYNDLISYGVRGATSDCGISGTIEQWRQIQKMYDIQAAGEIDAILDAIAFMKSIV